MAFLDSLDTLIAEDGAGGLAPPGDSVDPLLLGMEEIVGVDGLALLDDLLRYITLSSM